MIKLLICISSIIMLISCKSKNTADSHDHSTHDRGTTSGAWTEQYKQNFLDQCITGGTANFFEGDSVKAKSYCDCMLEKMQQAYPNTDTLNNMTMAEMQQRMSNMVNDCLPK